MSNIHPSLKEFAIEVDKFDHLPNNPRRGNVAAIAAALEEFGQVKPIVVRQKDDRYEILAGNHTLDAAITLGWEHIAAIVLDVDAERGLAYAVTDNRTVELGYTDEELLYDALGAIIDDYGDLMEDLGWDEFELAVLDSNMTQVDNEDTRGYVAPVVISPFTETPKTPEPSPMNVIAPIAARDEDGEVRLTAPSQIDTKTAVTAGSTAVGAAGSTRAVIQYTLTFDTYEQQKRWYDFMRWLRESPVYSGDTNIERLLDFIESHSEI